MFTRTKKANQPASEEQDRYRDFVEIYVQSRNYSNRIFIPRSQVLMVSKFLSAMHFNPEIRNMAHEDLGPDREVVICNTSKRDF